MRLFGLAFSTFLTFISTPGWAGNTVEIHLSKLGLHNQEYITPNLDPEQPGNDEMARWIDKYIEHRAHQSCRKQGLTSAETYTVNRVLGKWDKATFRPGLKRREVIRALCSRDLNEGVGMAFAEYGSNALRFLFTAATLYPTVTCAAGAYEGNWDQAGTQAFIAGLTGGAAWLTEKLVQPFLKKEKDELLEHAYRLGFYALKIDDLVCSGNTDHLSDEVISAAFQRSQAYQTHGFQDLLRPVPEANPEKGSAHKRIPSLKRQAIVVLLDAESEDLDFYTVIRPEAPQEPVAADEPIDVSAPLIVQ